MNNYIFIEYSKNNKTYYNYYIVSKNNCIYGYVNNKYIKHVFILNKKQCLQLYNDSIKNLKTYDNKYYDELNEILKKG